MPRQVEVLVADNKGVDDSFEGIRETIYLPDDLQGYAELWTAAQAHQERATTDAGAYAAWRALMRLWSAGDWFFRLVFVLTMGRDAYNPFRREAHFWHPVHITIARWCQFGNHEQEYLVASRGIGKSSHLTHNDAIGHAILDPSFSGAIFSHTREYAQKHLGVIMEELRKNALLKELWPDRFYRDPDEESPLFSLKDGLNIKRSSTRLEPTFGAYAFETSLPVGSHFDKRYYDDIEVDRTVESEAMMDKVEERYISSQDLSSGRREKAVTGTYYHPNGPLRRLEKNYGMTPKLFPSEDRSKPCDPKLAGPGGGIPQHGFTKTELEKIVADKGGRNSAKAMRGYARQYLVDPLAGEAAKLNRAYLQFYEGDPVEIGRRCHVYVTQDPSPGLNDPTWTWVWGLHPDRGYYWLDGWRRRVTPGRRLADTYLTTLKWNGIAQVMQVRIESYGQGGYAEAQEEQFREMGLDIPVVKVADPKASKRDREFEEWEPPLHEGRIWFPRTMIREGDGVGEAVDLVAYFIERELALYPLPDTDDGLDAGGLLWAREQAVGGPLEWPAEQRRPDHEPLRRYDDEIGESPMSGGIL